MKILFVLTVFFFAGCTEKDRAAIENQVKFDSQQVPGHGDGQPKEKEYRPEALTAKQMAAQYDPTKAHGAKAVTEFLVNNSTSGFYAGWQSPPETLLGFSRAFFTDLNGNTWVTYRPKWKPGWESEDRNPDGSYK